jgi:hypothetical protein
MTFARPLSERWRESTWLAPATVRPKLCVSRVTIRPASVPTLGRTVGAAEATWSAHSAVVTANTARTCRCLRVNVTGL